MAVHNPFPEHNHLASIATGVVGDNNVNCDKAVEIGNRSVSNLIGKNFHDVKLKRSARVLPLATAISCVKVNNTAIPVNTRQLFNRIIGVIKSNEHLSEYLQYELSPRPLSLFDDFGLRKTRKSTFFDVLEPLGEVEANSCDGGMYVIDGGFLLHRVVWPQNCTFADVLTAYETYITRHYGEIVTVIFDEYNSDCTKGMERIRRSVKLHSPTVMFTSSTPVVTSQEKFLANLKNKSEFINTLSKHLTAAGINVLQASGDADTQIVHTAIELSHTQSYPVSVIGEDIDLLVLLATLAREERDVTFIKPGRGKVPSKVYSSTKLQHNLGDMKTHLLFLHAVTGCDTTSAPYRQGKKKAYHMLKKRPDLQEQVSIFYHENATPEAVSAAGESFLLALYGAERSVLTLDQLRYRAFMKAIAKCPVTSEIQLEALPPTSAAAHQHSLRVYHQVQLWKGKKLAPTSWGWQRTETCLEPVMTVKAPAPESLLTLIYCNCKAGCERVCRCRHAGLMCTSMCGHCNGSGCSNSFHEDENPEDNTDDIETIAT
jgi:hypothetical protein